MFATAVTRLRMGFLCAPSIRQRLQILFAALGILFLAGTIRGQSIIDLEVDGFDDFAPLLVFPGEHPDRLRYKVSTTDGSPVNGSIRTRVFLSQDEVFSKDQDFNIGEIVRDLVLGTNQSVTISAQSKLGIITNYTFNVPVSETYFVFLEVDFVPGQGLIDLEPGNNVFEFPCPIMVLPRPANTADLVFVGLTAFEPSLIKVGAAPNSLQFQVGNKGPDNLGTSDADPEGFELSLFLSRDELFGNGDDIYIGSIVDSIFLKPGRTFINVTRPQSTLSSLVVPPAASGEYYLFGRLQYPAGAQLADPRLDNNVARLDTKIFVEGSGLPVIEVGPRNQAAAVEGSAALAVIARGQGPLHYQWQFNGQEITGATNATLILTGATTNLAGRYRVVVTNLLGRVTSNEAELNVVDKNIAVDLDLIRFEMIKPRDLLPGEHPESFQYIIMNHGPADVGSEIFIPPSTRIPNYGRVPLDLYLSRNPFFGDADDILIGSLTEFMLLEAEVTNIRETIARLGFPPIQIPTNAVGTYEVFMVVSPPAGLVDINPSNNVARLACPLTIASVPPGILSDLVIEDISSLTPSPISAGRSPERLEFSLGNKGFDGFGSSAQPAPVNFSFYLSKNYSFGDSDDARIGGISRNVYLDAGERTTISLSSSELQSLVVPSTANGDYWFFVSVNAPPAADRVDPHLENNYLTFESKLRVNTATQPDVRLTRSPDPASAQAFTEPATFTLRATILNSVPVTRVEFYETATLISTAATAPFELPLIQVPAGEYQFTAKAFGADGSQAESAPLAVSVFARVSPTFSFLVPALTVSEADHTNQLVVVKQGFGAASITVATAPLTNNPAKLQATAGQDFEPASLQLDFQAAEIQKTISIQLRDDFSFEENEQFSVILKDPSPGASLTNATVIVTITDNEKVGESFLSAIAPDEPPPHSARLKVLAQLGNSLGSGQWRFINEPEWRPTDVNVTGLAVGDYQVEFKPIASYLTPPRATIGITNIRDYELVGHFIPVGQDDLRGSLSIIIEPASLDGAWRFLDETRDADFRPSGREETGLTPGEYLIQFRPVPNHSTPLNLTVRVVANQLNSKTATYFFTQPLLGTPPSPPSLQQFSTIADPPYAFSGQIRSALGEGTGFVVRDRVVLTAAHVIVDDTTFIQASDIRWLQQRHRTVYEPNGRRAAGAIVMEGYADQRRAEGSPGSFSPASRDLDAAALYFFSPAGRGGVSGYLVSDDAENPWLRSTRNKMLVGYPVEKAPAIEPGIMHATTAFNVRFLRLTGSQRAYWTQDIRSYKGNSGGPLLVQLDPQRFGDPTNIFFPAGIYLGGTEQTIVRAIDSQVVDLIRRAEVAGNTGEGSVGGGSGDSGNTLTRSNSFGIGLLTVNLAPTTAVTSGARWRVRDKTEFTAQRSPIALTNGTYTLEFTNAPGFTAPASRTIEIVNNQTTKIDVNFDLHRLSIRWCDPTRRVLCLAWDSGFVLQSSDTVTGPWQNVTTTTNSLSLTIAGTTKFFRLRP